MADGDAVSEIKFSVYYTVREWSQDSGEPRYDWINDAGTESFELFETVEEALDDIRSRH